MDSVIYKCLAFVHILVLNSVYLALSLRHTQGGVSSELSLHATLTHHLLVIHLVIVKTVLQFMQSVCHFYSQPRPQGTKEEGLDKQNNHCDQDVRLLGVIDNHFTNVSTIRTVLVVLLSCDSKHEALLCTVSDRHIVRDTGLHKMENSETLDVLFDVSQIERHISQRN